MFVELEHHSRGTKAFALFAVVVYRFLLICDTSDANYDFLFY